MSKVRTRFAPSPTGYLHVGGIRTALFAWLLARQNNGSFILRLEDTDKSREVAGTDQHIMDSLRALGLNYDEGPDVGGSFGPYRQSERLESYKQWATKLVESGRAYADPYTPEQVQAFRDQAKAEKKPFLYRNHRPSQELRTTGQPDDWYGRVPLRFKSEPKAYIWHDEVMGDLSTGPEVIDDFIIMKSDGYPTYNFAHIIDDMLMQITHVIRGQEFLASTPNYLNLYEALDIEHPILATMPHILGPAGNKKLSKRDGAKDVLDYIRGGYLPEAMVNFIATLGWNDGTEQEVFAVNELIQKFSLDRVQKSGARFDERRLLWLNGAHIRNLTIAELGSRITSFWPEAARSFDQEYRQSVLELVQERLKFFDELPELSSFFFAEPQPNLELIDNNKQLSKFTHSELGDLLNKVIEELKLIDFDPESVQSTLNKLLEKTNQKPGVLFSLVRISTTWAPASPDLAKSLSVLGKDKSVRRLVEAQKLLKADVASF